MTLSMRASRVSGGWTGTFLAASVLTSVTGFLFFSPPSFTPAQGTGIVALLLALAQEAEVLILDEPTFAIDSVPVSNSIERKKEAITVRNERPLLSALQTIIEFVEGGHAHEVQGPGGEIKTQVALASRLCVGPPAQTGRQVGASCMVTAHQHAATYATSLRQAIDPRHRVMVIPGFVRQNFKRGGQILCLVMLQERQAWVQAWVQALEVRRVSVAVDVRSLVVAAALDRDALADQLNLVEN